MWRLFYPTILLIVISFLLHQVRYLYYHDNIEFLINAGTKVEFVGSNFKVSVWSIYMRVLKIILTFMCIVIAAWTISGRAEEATETKGEKTCLYLMSIGSLDIIDNQNIAFRMKNGDYYLNKLPNNCPMLRPNNVIMYKTPLNSLGSLDIIDVLDHIGGGFQYYGSCGLGKFTPATRDEIQQLKERVQKNKSSE